MARRYRLQVPVSQETRHAIEEYADALGVSPATAASMLLEESTPALRELSEALRSVQGSPARALRAASNALQKAVQEANQVSMDLQPQPKRARRKAS